MAEPRDSRFGSVTGVDLLAPVIRNLNPLDIKPTSTQPVSSVWEKWLYFWGFANKYLDKNNTTINTEEGKQKITLKLIEDFNNDSSISDWAKFGNSSPNRGLNNPLTREDIFAIQRFTQKTDPRVIVDGWIGTQTVQMLYPSTYTKINLPLDKIKDPSKLDPNKFYPVIWGNKRYVVTVKNYTNQFTEDPNKKLTFTPPAPLPSFLIPYNPEKHDDKFEGTGNKSKDWIALGTNFTPNETAEKTNAETSKTINQKNTLQLQTKINNSL